MDFNYKGAKTKSNLLFRNGHIMRLLVLKETLHSGLRYILEILFLLLGLLLEHLVIDLGLAFALLEPLELLLDEPKTVEDTLLLELLDLRLDLDEPAQGRVV